MKGASMTSENVTDHEAVESPPAVSAKAVYDRLIDEPDRDGSFEPKIVKKRQKRLTGVGERHCQVDRHPARIVARAAGPQAKRAGQCADRRW
ncbi:hypothetical protein [Streptomyces malaysiensis]